MIKSIGILTVYSKDLNAIVSVIDDYISALFTVRYDTYGDFVLELPKKYDKNRGITRGGFIKFEDSSRLFYIEDIEETEGELPDMIRVTGSSIEKFLSLRVLLNNKLFIERTPYFVFDTLLNENVVSPASSHRKLPYLGIQHHLGLSPILQTIKITEQIEITTVLDALRMCLSPIDIGFSFTFNFVSTPKIRASILYGENRTSEQTVNPPVIFSSDFDNVAKGKFFYRSSDFINTAYVVTEDPILLPGQTIDDVEYPEYRKFFVTQRGEPYSGYERLEGIVSATDLKRDLDPDEPPLNDTEFENLMRFRAYEWLSENSPSGVFEATLPPGNNGYGTDFFMGDIVEIRIFSVKLKARIIERTKSSNSSGTTEYLSFKFTEEL